MTIELKLDTNALESLFPAGSEARVNLQKAVIANFIRAHVKPSFVTAEVEKLVKEAQTEAVKQVLAEMGLRPHWNGTTTLSDTAKREIELQARRALEPMVDTAVKAGVRAAAELIEPRIKQHVEYETNINIKRAVSDHVAKIAAELSK